MRRTSDGSGLIVALGIIGMVLAVGGTALLLGFGAAGAEPAAAVTPPARRLRGSPSVGRGPSGTTASASPGPAAPATTPAPTVPVTATPPRPAVSATRTPEETRPVAPSAAATVAGGHQAASPP